MRGRFIKPDESMKRIIYLFFLKSLINVEMNDFKLEKKSGQLSDERL